MNDDDLRRKVRLLIRRAKAVASRNPAPKRSEIERRIVPSPTAEEHLDRMLEVIQEALRRHGVTALFPFFAVWWHKSIRARFERLRCHLAYQDIASCASASALNGTLVAITVVALAGTLATGGALLAPRSQRSAVAVAARVTGLLPTTLPLAIASEDTSSSLSGGKEQTAAPAIRTAVSSSSVAPSHTPARVTTSADVERGIRLGGDRTTLVWLDENTNSSSETYVWISCAPESKVKTALCDAYDAVAGATQSSPEDR